jgi:hypothetical protein
VTAAIHYAFDYACAVYLVMYYTFSQPRAVVWQMYVVTAAIYYACTGMAYTLSQVHHLVCLTSDAQCCCLMHTICRQPCAVVQV